jgi:CHAT domain-containing protein
LSIDADLAYLSACDTAVSTRRFADEAFHIGGAFQSAGYRNFVGTLWKIGDDVAAWFAEAFYRYLTDGGTAEPAPDRAADALHYATNCLRRKHPDEPGLWAAFTHIGA